MIRGDFEVSAAGAREIKKGIRSVYGPPPASLSRENFAQMLFYITL